MNVKKKNITKIFFVHMEGGKKGSPKNPYFFFFSLYLIIWNCLKIYFSNSWQKKKISSLNLKIQRRQLSFLRSPMLQRSLHLVMPWCFTTPHIAWLRVTFHANEGVIKINHTISTVGITILRSFALNGHFYITSANFLEWICLFLPFSPFFLFLNRYLACLSKILMADKREIIGWFLLFCFYQTWANGICPFK